MLSISALSRSVGWHHSTVWQCLKRHRIPFQRRDGKVFVERDFIPVVRALLRKRNYAKGFAAFDRENV